MIDSLSQGSEPQYVTDSAGNRVAVLIDIGRYHELLDAADELDAIRAFDAAKASGGEAIPLEDALSEIEQDRQRR